MRALTFAVAHLTDDDGVLLAAGCIDNEFIHELTSKPLRLENGVRRTVRILVLIRVRQLLHAIKAPAVKTTFFRDGKAVSITRDYFNDLIWDHHFLRSSMSHFEERGDFLTIFLSLSALSKSIVSHGPDLPLAIEHD